MNVTDLNIKYEIAKVQTELIFFRDQCLPAFLDREVDDSLGEEYAEWVREKIQAVAGPLSGWQRATASQVASATIGKNQQEITVATNSDSRSTFLRTVSRRRFLLQASLTSAILAAASSLGGVRLFADDQPKPAGEMTKTVSLEGLDVSLQTTTGGLSPGGTNFDAKVRRESIDPIDLFHAHIGGMDAFARGLKIAAAIRADGILTSFVKERYSSYDSGIGRKIENGTTNMRELESYIVEKGEAAANTSGRQEMLENLINRYI